MTKKPYHLSGRELAAYREGFLNGNESDYFPGGYATGKAAAAAYDRGYRDGQKHGDRKGRPWTLPEILKLSRGA